MEIEDARLHRVAHRRLDLGLALTELACAARMHLALGEAAVHDRAPRAPHRNVDEVERLAQLAREDVPAVDLTVRSRHVAELEKADDTATSPVEDELTVARPLTEADDLVGDDEPLPGGVGSPERHPPRPQHASEVARVVE